MISSLTEHGRVGMTAVGDTAEDAEARYQDAQRILLEEASSAFNEPPLPD
jgi:predicted RNase H-like HicB family nuclease